MHRDEGRSFNALLWFSGVTSAGRAYPVPLKGALYDHLEKSGFLINIPPLPFKPEKITSYEYPLGN